MPTPEADASRQQQDGMNIFTEHFILRALFPLATPFIARRRRVAHSRPFQMMRAGDIFISAYAHYLIADAIFRCADAEGSALLVHYSSPNTPAAHVTPRRHE